MMGGSAPQTPRDLALFFPEWMVFAFLVGEAAVHWRGLIGRQGNAGMRPERRFKPGMVGGLRAASWSPRRTI
jgi:hypothetical protein